jgi:uncharacterized membrane protein
MTTLTMTKLMGATSTPKNLKRKRIESIDLLRGIVMIIMALDHVRDYFHHDAFLFDPTDRTQTSGILFFTRFITHYCAPVFVFLAGISAYLYGARKSKKELAWYLFTRGIWLVLVELFIISLALTFNPSYPMFNLQVIWAIGFSMIGLSAMIFMNKRSILLVGVLLIAGHNLVDGVNVPGNGIQAFIWSFLHKPGDFVLGHFNVFIHYPIIPWIGVIALGYYFGSFYKPGYNPSRRRQLFSSIGFAAITLFFFLRIFNLYGDAVHWSIQKNVLFSFLSLINVTKYPPSLLYLLITLGPAMIFLGEIERPLNAFIKKISVFGRVPFFYYVAHLYLIHFAAMIAAIISGYNWSDMILSNRVNRVLALKGYGFNLFTVYLVWIALVIFLYPFCKWFDSYKRTHQPNKRWLTYL